jgi:hypothetical protein
MISDPLARRPGALSESSRFIAEGAAQAVGSRSFPRDGVPRTTITSTTTSIAGLKKDLFAQKPPRIRKIENPTAPGHSCGGNHLVIWALSRAYQFQ